MNSLMLARVCNFCKKPTYLVAESRNKTLMPMCAQCARIEAISVPKSTKQTKFEDAVTSLMTTLTQMRQAC